MGDDFLKIAAPHIVMRSAAIKAETHRLIAAWRAAEPGEMEKWKKYVHERRASLRDEKGFTQLRHLMALCILPSYVVFGIGRFLARENGVVGSVMNWQNEDPEALEAVLSVIPEGRMNQTSGVRCDGDK